MVRLDEPNSVFRRGNVTREVECTRCKHLRPRQTCGHAQSPFAGKHVDSKDRCDYFVANPAQDEYEDALLILLNEDSSIAAIPKLKKAIEQGLPEDNEMFARFALSGGYREIVGNAGLSLDEMASRAEFSQAIAEAEKALEIDRKGGYGYFAEPLNRASLYKLNFLYQIAARTIERERGNRDAISYVENKLQIFRYLPSTPMIFLLKHLAYLYAEDGQSAEAHRCLREILNADPVLKVDDKGEEQKLRSEASQALASLSVPARNVETSPQTKLQKKALASIVCGVVGLLLLGWILGPIAIVLGLQARSGISRSNLSGGGKAIAGIIVGSLATLIGVLRLLR